MKKPSLPAQRRHASSSPDEWSSEEISFFCLALGIAPRYLQQANETLIAEHSLGPRGAWIIGLIASGISSPSDIAQCFQIGRSLVTAELSRLFDAQLVKRNDAVVDRRRYELELTELGEQVHHQMHVGFAETITSRFVGYSKAEIMAFAEMLRDFCIGPALVIPDRNGAVLSRLQDFLANKSRQQLK